MFWQHSKHDMKTLLVTTLVLASAFALFAGQQLEHYSDLERAMQAKTVGVFAGVEPNEQNTLAAQLTEREKELDAREQAIIETQLNRRENELLIVSIVGVGLLGLILFNFYLDSRRRAFLRTQSQQ